MSEGKLPCGCYGVLGDDEKVSITAEGFLCPARHKQGAVVTLADVASLAIANALDLLSKPPSGEATSATKGTGSSPHAD